MASSDLSLVLAWRNHPDVRKYMYTQHEISMDEHRRWFEKCASDTAYHLLIFEKSANPLGFINIHQIAPGGIADWGFYSAPEAPKGTGRQLGQLAVRYALGQLGLQKLCGRALAHNERSICFHQKLGFQREGVLRQQHFDGQCYHDIVCFGLLASEWRTQN